jgi:lysophospholipase L1-like esterase
MVIIFAGMGDAAKDPPVELTEFQANIQELVRRAQENGIRTVLVMPFRRAAADNQENLQEYIEAYRGWLVGYAESSDDVELLVDFQDFLCDEHNIKELYLTQKFYPNEDGYERMGKHIAELLKDKI